MKPNDWNGRPYHEVVRDFANFLLTIKEEFFRNKEIESEMNKKQQDLLHDLELGNHKYHDIARLGKEIRELRINRRGYKDAMLYTTPIKIFIKDEHDEKKYTSELFELADKLELMAKMVEEQYYNIKSSISNITTMKKDSNKDEDIRSEDLIQINRILDKYCISMESEFSGKDAKLDCPVIVVKMQMEHPFNLNSGKKIITDLSGYIERFYKLRNGNPITCTSSSSDMCIQDEYGKNSLPGVITIYEGEDKPIYVINLKIREGKHAPANAKGGKKKGKGGKKKRR